MPRNVAGGVADKRAARCSSWADLHLTTLEAALALHAERRLGLGSKAQLRLVESLKPSAPPHVNLTSTGTDDEKRSR